MKKKALFILLISSYFGYSQIDTKYDGNVVIEPLNKEEKKVEYAEDHIFQLIGVHTKPEYPEGLTAFNDFIKANLQKPKGFPEGLKGKIFTSFVVEKDGSLSNIKITRDIGYGIGEEVIKTLKLSKKWKPALVNDKPVRAEYFYPITIN